MKWDTIKNKVACEVHNKLVSEANGVGKDVKMLFALQFVKSILAGQPQKNYDTFKEVREALFSIVDNWDIRNYKVLLEEYPKAFPSFVRKGNCAIEYDDKGWHFVNTKQMIEY